jgi:protocatechuate 3,4-dioxygenase beta subunit
MGAAKLGRILVAFALLAAIVASVRLLERDVRETATPEEAAVAVPASTDEPRHLLRDAPVDERTEAPLEPAKPSSPSSNESEFPAQPKLVVEVLDENGRGVSDVSVGLVFQDQDGTYRGAGAFGRTDTSGKCVLDPSVVTWRSRGPWWRVEGSVAGEALVVVPRRVPEGTERVTLAVLRTGRIVGSVSRRDGKPIEDGTALELHWRVDDSPETERDTYVEQGAFEAGLVGRVSRVVLNPNPHAPCELVLDLVVPPGETVRADLVFDAPPVLVATLIDAADRSPILGVRLKQPVESESVSDEHGTLVVPDVLRPGTRTRLRFEHEDYTPVDARVTAPPGASEWPVVVELQRSPVLRGIVVDARSMPLPGIEVMCERRIDAASGGMGLLLFSKGTVTDEEGRFRLSGLPSRGDVQMSFARKEGDRIRVLWSELVELPRASERERWVVSDAIAIRGRLLDGAGRPVQDTQIHARHALGRIQVMGRTGEGGEFELDGATPGRWTLWVNHGAEIVHEGTTAQQCSLLVDGDRSGRRRLARTRDAAAARP